MVRKIQRLSRLENFGYLAGVVLVAAAIVANVAKLVLNLLYWYAHADVQQTGVDPVTGFAIGVGVIAVAWYLVSGVRKRSVWAAVGLTVVMPLLYVQMVDGLVAALLHEQMVFAEQEVTSLFVEVLPAALLTVLYGAQALSNYHQRFRRIG